MNVPAHHHRRMRLADRVSLAFGAIGRHRVRTLLTLLGIVIGTFALVVSLAVGRGVDRAVVNLFRQDDQLRRIYVSPSSKASAEEVPESAREIRGAMSDARRARLLKRRMNEWSRNMETPQIHPLDASAVSQLGSLAHVVRAMPTVRIYGEASSRQKEAYGFLGSIDSARPLVAERLTAGRTPRPGERDVALAHEYLLYQLGYESEEAAAGILGQTIEFAVTSRDNDPLRMIAFVARRQLGLSDTEMGTLDRAVRRVMQVARFVPMPKAEKELLERALSPGVVALKPAAGEQARHAYQIIGIYRDVDAKTTDRASIFDEAVRNSGLIVTPEAGAAFHDSLPRLRAEGYSGAQVLVDDEANVEGVVESIKAQGFECYSLVEFLGTVRMNVLLVSTATAFIAIIALLVAAIGIANTMIMSVLERTREIGIMKALGARDRQIRGIFVLEGAALGLIGGVVGTLLGWLAHFPGDRVAQSIIQKQVDSPIRDSLFAYPVWLVIGAPLLAAAVATIAAFYPAMRAARVDPVTSLRHD